MRGRGERKALGGYGRAVLQRLVIPWSNPGLYYGAVQKRGRKIDIGK